MYILLEKNYIIMSRNREILKTLVIPILTFVLLLTASTILMFKPHIELQDNLIYSQMALYFVPISLMSVVRNVVYSMVEEKATKQKEVQKVLQLHKIFRSWA